MRKVRVFELAREMGLDNRALITKIRKMGISVNNHMTALDEVDATRIQRQLESEKRNKPEDIWISDSIFFNRASSKTTVSPSLANTKEPGVAQSNNSPVTSQASEINPPTLDARQKTLDAQTATQATLSKPAMAKEPAGPTLENKATLPNHLGTCLYCSTRVKQQNLLSHQNRRCPNRSLDKPPSPVTVVRLTLTPPSTAQPNTTTTKEVTLQTETNTRGQETKPTGQTSKKYETLCPCGGINDSCYRCDGKGWYSPSTRHQQATVKPANKQPEPEKIRIINSKPEWGICRYCKEKTRTSILALHETQYCPKRDSSTKTKEPSKPPATPTHVIKKTVQPTPIPPKNTEVGVVEAAVLAAPHKLEVVEALLATYYNEYTTEGKQTSLSREERVIRILVLYRKSPDDVLSNNKNREELSRKYPQELQWLLHNKKSLQKQYFRWLFENSAPAAGPIPRIKESSLNIIETEHPRQLRNPNLDAAYRIGFYARENGKFGSHALHDDSDDSSKET
jgi:hypothetical protein